MLRRTRSTGKCVFTGLASGGTNHLEYIHNTLIVPDGVLGGGVYGGKGFSAGNLQGCSSETNFRPAAVGV